MRTIRHQGPGSKYSGTHRENIFYIYPSRIIFLGFKVAERDEAN